MKRLLLIFIAILVTSCSFDNKTGIWKDASNTVADNKDYKTIEVSNSNTRYEKIFNQTEIFNEEKENLTLTNIKNDNPVKVTNWLEQYAISTNNISNFSYNGKKTLLSKSSKLSKFSSSKSNSKKNFVFYKGNLISYDHKGTIYIYSLNLKKKIFEYNFYKKKFKSFKKEIYLVVNKNILYVADNLGYLYAINLDDKFIIWAKNYGIPFRSNLKFSNNQVFLANQDNVIYSINANTGEKNWQFTTSLTFLKSDFKNNFALDIINDKLFFINTSGELYSINYLNRQIDWILNFKNSSLAGETELFLGHPIVIKNNNIIISPGRAVLSFDSQTGLKNWNFPVETVFKPIVTSNYTYIVSKNDLLICLDSTSGNVVWSKNIYSNTKKKIKKTFESIIDFKIVNGEINIYSSNGYLLSFNSSNGNLNHLNKISKKGISSEIFFLNENMLFVDNNNKLLKFN